MRPNGWRSDAELPICQGSHLLGKNFLRGLTQPCPLVGFCRVRYVTGTVDYHSITTIKKGWPLIHQLFLFPFKTIDGLVCTGKDSRMSISLKFDNSLGATLIGFSVSCVVFGTLSTQCFSYFQRYPLDKPVYKILVCAFSHTHMSPKLMI